MQLENLQSDLVFIGVNREGVTGSYTLSVGSDEFIWRLRDMSSFFGIYFL